MTKELPKESTFKKRVISRLRKFKNITVFTIQQVAIRGVPDLLCCINGRFVALELKRTERAKVSELQLYNIERIKESGGYATLLYPENFDQIMKELEQL